MLRETPRFSMLRFACPSCGQHISATRAQIGITGRCPNCNAAIAVPKASTLPPPAPWPLVRFACPSCGLHISATHAQIGVTAPCPNCNAAVTVPKTSTLPPPPPAPLKTKFREKKTLRDHCDFDRRLCGADHKQETKKLDRRSH